MKLKNKILLTIIAFIFVICLFNTNCFATDYTFEDLDTTITVPDEILENYYVYVFIYPKGSGYSGVNIISEKPIYLTYEYSSITDSYLTYFNCDDGYIVYYDSNSLSSIKSNLESKTLTDLTATKNTVGYGIDINTLTSSSYYISSSDVSYNDEVVFTNNITERGTEDDNTSTDSGDTGNETTGTDTENTTDSDDSGGILSSIKEGFTNVIDFFTQLVDNVKNILSYLNPTSENFILNKIISFFEELLNFFNPEHENFIGKTILNLVKDFFELWFKPKQESFTAIKDSVESKFSFIDTIKTSANSIKDLISNVGSAPSLTINLNDNKYGVNEVTLIDLEWYKPYKTYGDLILTGFIYAFFLWRLFISLPNIIHGVGGAVQGGFKVYDYTEEKKF